MKGKVKRLKYLSGMLNKYGHRWGDNPSDRLCNWVDEYDDIRRNEPEAWHEFCRQMDYDADHYSFDAMA